MVIGIIILVLGTAFLLRNLGVISFDAGFWSVFYPLMIMGVGFIILLATYEGRKFLKKIKKMFSTGEEDKT